MQAVNPGLGSILRHFIEGFALCLGSKVKLSPLTPGKRRGRPEDDGLVGLATECEQHSDGVVVTSERVAQMSKRLDFIGIFQQVVATEASRVAPSLIDAVDGVVAIDRLGKRVHSDVALALVAVGHQEHMHLLIPLRGDAEDGRMAAARHLHPKVLVGQSHAIVMGVGHLLAVAEAAGTLPHTHARSGCPASYILPAEGREGEGAVVLRAASHNPVAVAEALEERVGIVIRRHALLLRVAGLWCPEVLPVGGKDCGQGLPMLLGALAEEAGGPGVGRSRAHHGVQAAELAQVLQAVDALVDARLDGRPRLHGDALLVVEHLHQHVALRVLIEYHLQVGGHGQYLVHALAPGADAHERHQPVEVGVVAEAQVGPHPTSRDGRLGVGLDALPEREGRAGWDAVVAYLVAIADGHALIVLPIDGLQLLLGEDVVERHAKLHVLHVGSDGVQLGHQPGRSVHL